MNSIEILLRDLWLHIQTYYNSIIVLAPKILVASLIFSFFYMLANRGRSLVNSRLSKRMDDPLLVIFLGQVTKIILLIIAFLLILQVLGLSGIASGIVTGASVSAIVIGFAFKDIGENFLAGIMLAFNRPFQVGDTVELDGHKGKVIALNLRNARIKTPDGKDIFIPNANVIKNPVVNYTMDGFLRYEFVVGLEYGSNVGDAIKIILAELKSIKGILQDQKSSSIAVSDLGINALELTIYYWINTFDAKINVSQIKIDAIDRILTALDKSGFYLPGQVIEMKNYKGENLLMGKTKEDF